MLLSHHINAQDYLVFLNIVDTMCIKNILILLVFETSLYARIRI